MSAVRFNQGPKKIKHMLIYIDLQSMTIRCIRRMVVKNGRVCIKSIHQQVIGNEGRNNFMVYLCPMSEPKFTRQNADVILDSIKKLASSYKLTMSPPKTIMDGALVQHQL